jgi:hypothetical protein
MAEEIARMLVGDELGAGMMSVKTVATEVNGPETLNKVAASGDVTRIVEEQVEIERRRRERTQPAPSEIDVPVPVDPFAGLQFMYRPVWDVRRSAVANFYLLPVKPIAGGQARVGDSEIAGHGADPGPALSCRRRFRPRERSSPSFPTVRPRRLPYRCSIPATGSSPRASACSWTGWSAPSTCAAEAAKEILRASPSLWHLYTDVFYTGVSQLHSKSGSAARAPITAEMRL